MPRHAPHPLVLRIRRARMSLAAAEQELIAARDRNDVREISRIERELPNRRAYVAELLAMARSRSS